MRKLFNGYYRPSDKEFDHIWETAAIALDANVLLNLYRYSTDTRDRLMSILKEFAPRLWLPHQAALEFHKNRLAVVYEQINVYEKIKSLLDTSRGDLEKKFDEFKRHPIIKIDLLMGRLNRAFESVQKHLEEYQLKHPGANEDQVLDVITDIFNGRVGDPYDDHDLEKIFKSGELRYAKQKPPGYMDAQTKKDDGKFGDYIIWCQLIDFAKREKKPVILITDDAKEDWWLRVSGKTIGPRPELINEMQKEASVGFYMYKTDQFMEYSKKIIKKTVSIEALTEVRDVRDRAVFTSHLSSFDTNTPDMFWESQTSLYIALINEIEAINSELQMIESMVRSGEQGGDENGLESMVDRFRFLRKQLIRLSSIKSDLEKDDLLDSEYTNNFDEISRILNRGKVGRKDFYKTMLRKKMMKK